MQKPFIVAAAVAAGVISFASASQESAAASLRVDQATPVVTQAAAATPVRKVTKTTKTVKAGKKASAAKTPKLATTSKVTGKTASAKSAVEPCPYLFGCSKDTKTVAAKTVTAKTVTNAKAVKGTKKIAKAKTKVIYDTVTTASITSGAVKPAVVSGSGTRYSTIVSRYASAYGVPVSLAHAVIQIESNYRPGMIGRAGEIGLMQIKPATARMMGYSGSAKGLHNPETNIKYGMKYLGMARDLGGGTTCGTILKYNAGHGAKRMNPISSAYCRKVVAQIGRAG